MTLSTSRPGLNQIAPALKPFYITQITQFDPLLHLNYSTANLFHGTNVVSGLRSELWLAGGGTLKRILAMVEWEYTHILGL